MPSPADALISAHRSLLGLRGAALADALTPTAAPDVRAGIDALSTCELEAAAGIRLAFGLPLPPPYIPGGDHAARALCSLTGGGLPYAVKPGGALRVPTLEEPPELADSVWYAPAPGHPEHVDGCVCEEPEGLDVGADPSTQIRFTAIAGGQPDGAGHYSGIAEVERALLWVGGHWRCRATGRVVWCVISAEALGRLYLAGE